MKISVPLQGSAVNADQQNTIGAIPSDAPSGPQAGALSNSPNVIGPNSLHKVQLPPSVGPVEVQYKYVFDEHGRARAVPATHESEGQAGQLGDQALAQASSQQIGEIPADPGAPQYSTAAEAGGFATNGANGAYGQNNVAALQKQIQDLTTTVQLLTQHALQGAQAVDTNKGPEPPDPTKFDLYDANQLAEFNRLNSAYLRAEVSHQLSNVLAPHGNALQTAQWTADYNMIRVENHNDPNFDIKADAALRLVQSNPQKFTIPEAYKYVSSLPIVNRPAPGVQGQQPEKANQVTPSQAPLGQNGKRTITTQEAETKAEQAKMLATNTNGSVAGQVANMIPANIKGLGDIIAYNKQFGRRG